MTRQSQANSGRQDFRNWIIRSAGEFQKGSRMAKLADRIGRDRLDRLYSIDKLSTCEIAERLGSNRESVRKLLKRYGIALRARGYPFRR